MSRLMPQGIHRSTKRVTLIINEAQTGRQIPVELAQGEDGADVLRSKLYRVTGVPPENQILLCGGPPFKALRAQLPASITAAGGDTLPAVPAWGSGTSSPASTLSSAGGATSTREGSDGAKDRNRIFLFDWRALAPERPASAAPLISAASASLLGDDSSLSLAAGAASEIDNEAAEYVGPAEVLLPTEAGPAPSPLPSAEGSVLLATIANYERGSMLALNRGQAYADMSARRLQGGELCVERMETQIEALKAAVSNSLDHWEPLQQGYRALSVRLEEQAARHQRMLETFEEDLARLGTIPLHPALVAAALSSSRMLASGRMMGAAFSTTSLASAAGVGASGIEGGPGAGSIAALAGVPDAAGSVGAGGPHRQQSQGAQKLSTLLDCVPVGREQKLLESCRTSQRRFRQEAEAVAQKYETIKRGLEQQRSGSISGTEEVRKLLSKARGLCEEQERRRGELQANYKEAFLRATKENWIGDHEKQDAIQRMTELTVTQERIVPLMKDNDLRVMETVAEIAKAKATLSAALRQRLREVSRLQTDIGKIQKHQELVSMAWEKKEDQFGHLDKVAKMPAAYRAFLSEVVRRRRYHVEFETKVKEFCESMAALRSTEIVAREVFLGNHLGNLPPTFLEMAPGLRNAPPVFSTPPVTPLYPGELPDVKPEDVIESDVPAPPPPSTSPPRETVAEPTVIASVESSVESSSAPSVVPSAAGPVAAPPEESPELALPSASEVISGSGSGSGSMSASPSVSAVAGLSTMNTVVVHGDSSGESGLVHVSGVSDNVSGDDGGNGICDGEGDGDGDGDGDIASEKRDEKEASKPEQEGLVEGQEEVEGAERTQAAAAALVEASRVGDEVVGEGPLSGPAWAPEHALKAENTRLVKELAAVRTCLEELERAQQASFTRKAEAVAAATVSAAATETVGKKDKATSDEEPFPGTASRKDSSGEESVPSPGDSAVEDIGGTSGKSHARTRTSRRRSVSDAAESTDSADALETEALRGRSVSSAGAYGEGALKVAEVWHSIGRRSTRGAGSRGEARATDTPWVGASKRSSSGSSSSATQNQLAAYRAGLSMLVKLADQLAAAAATAAGVVPGPGVSARGEWESVHISSGRPNAGDAALSSGVTASGSAGETSLGDSRAGAALASARPAEAPGGGGLGGSESQAPSVSSAPSSGSGTLPPASCVVESRANAEAPSPRLVEDSAVTAHGEVREYARAQDGAEGTIVERASLTSGEAAAERASCGGEDRDPTKHEEVVTSGTKEQGRTVSARVSRDDQGDGGSVAPSTPSPLPGMALGSTNAPSPPTVSGEIVGKTVFSVAPPARNDSSLSCAREGSLPDNRARERESQAVPAAERTIVSGAGSTTTASGRGRESTLSRAGGGRSGSGASASGTVSSAVAADIGKIKKAAEYVATFMRRTHGRVEQLSAYEALAAVPKISMCSFDVHDIALFLPTGVRLPDGSGGTVFLAFHVNCPNRYLAEESVSTARENLGSYPPYFLGRVLMVERHVASEEHNPYNVASDTVYYVLTAESVC